MKVHSQIVQIDDLLMTYHMRQEVSYNKLKSNCFSVHVDELTYFTNKVIPEHLYMPLDLYRMVKFKKTLYAAKATLRVKKIFWH